MLDVDERGRRAARHVADAIGRRRVEARRRVVADGDAQARRAEGGRGARRCDRAGAARVRVETDGRAGLGGSDQLGIVVVRGRRGRRRVDRRCRRRARVLDVRRRRGATGRVARGVARLGGVGGRRVVGDVRNVDAADEGCGGSAPGGCAGAVGGGIEGDRRPACAEPVTFGSLSFAGDAGSSESHRRGRGGGVLDVAGRRGTRGGVAGGVRGLGGVARRRVVRDVRDVDPGAGELCRCSASVDRARAVGRRVDGDRGAPPALPVTFGSLSFAGDAGLVPRPVGALGPVESSTYATAAEHAEVLPAASVALAV